MRVYLPPDANCLLSVMDHCLRSRHYVNVVVAGKHPAPQWLAMDAAAAHCTQGIGIWDWAGSDPDSRGARRRHGLLRRRRRPPEPRVAVQPLRAHLPALKIRVVNVVDLMKLQPQSEEFPARLLDDDEISSRSHHRQAGISVAYPSLIHKLTYRRTNHNNIHAKSGYKEEGARSRPCSDTAGPCSTTSTASIS